VAADDKSVSKTTTREEGWRTLLHIYNKEYNHFAKFLIRLEKENKNTRCHERHKTFS
jgi:hypothetical protein